MNGPFNGKLGKLSSYRANGPSVDAAPDQCAIDPRVRWAIEYIEEHIHDSSETLRLKSLAKFVNLSPFHFHRLFKKSMGLSPREHVLRRRIERAKTLIRRRPDLTLIQIAIHVGCTNPSHLCRIFQKREGVTPSQYQDICQNSEVVQNALDCVRIVSRLLEG